MTTPQFNINFTTFLGSCSGDRCLKGSLDSAILELGTSLFSQNGKYELKMQTDGNLVIYCNNGNAIWHSDTWGRAVVGGLHFQVDSNLVIYDPTPIWHSGSYNTGGTTLVMQDDGNCVMYTRSGIAVWHTSTYNRC